MGLINGLWLFVLGVLGASSLIIAKKPDAKELIGKLTPYQGWIGAISAVWGVFGLISSLFRLNWLAHWPILWLTWFVDAALLLALGLLLGVGVMKTFITNPEAQAKMDQTIAKLAPYQGKFGVAAMIFGVWMVLANLIFVVV